MSISNADLYRAFDTPPHAIVAFLTWLVAVEQLPQRPHVADIGAGVGRLIAPVASLGWSVTAYEPDSDYFPAAAAEGARFSEVLVKQGGFEDVTEDAAFHLACGINSSYAHLLSPRARTLALRRLRRAVRPGGILVLDLPNFPWVLAHYRPPVPEERTWEGHHIVRRREHKLDQEHGTFTTVDHHLVSGPARESVAFTKHHIYAIVAPDTHTAELTASGFDDVRVFPSFEARVPTTAPAGRLIYVARRAAAG